MYVSLVGRSNVGKSCLFNSILAHVGKRSSILRSIVSENPGTTRDSKQSEIYIRGNKVTLVDTGGFEGILGNNGPNHTSNIHNSLNTGNSFTNNNFPHTLIQNETHKAIQNSNLVLFVLDGKQGVTPLDIQMGQKLREWIESSHTKPEVRVVINKLENHGSEEYFEDLSECLTDCYSLEFGDPVVVSAHQNEGIDKITSIIKSRLKPRDTSRLEEMAIVGNHLDHEKHFDYEKALEDDKQLDDIEDLHKHYEIEKSLRTCSSVKGTYKPNDKWIKLLNNVCGIPFIEREDDKFIVPSLLSPSERLARLYISDKKRETEAEINASLVQESLDDEDAYQLQQTAEDKQQPYNLDQMNQQKQEISEEMDADKTGSSDNNRHNVRSKVKIFNENVINPINILVLGSVDSDRDTLLSLLCNNYGYNKLSDLSPNWHSFYSNWPVKSNGKQIEQPVEIVVSAALNLGGSIGKMSVLQTLPLLRKCDFVIFCIDNSNELRRTPDGHRNVILSRREIAWLSRAVRFQKPTTLAVHVPSGHKNCKLFLTKDYPLSFEFKNIPIVPLPRDSATASTATNTGTPSLALASANTTASKSADKLRNIIISLLNRGKQMIDTSTLNAWLNAFIAKWSPPWKDGSKINLKFAAQVRASPPTFVLWSNVYASFPQHYLRQLKLALSEEFGFLGVPLKFVLKTTFKSNSRLKRMSSLKLKRKLFN